MLMCANCLGSGERVSPAMGQPPVGRSGEQSPTAEELEIDRLRAELSEVRAELVAMTAAADDQRQRRKEAEAVNAQLRADNRHLLEAMTSIAHAMTSHGGDKVQLLVSFGHVRKIATDTLGRVAR